MRLMKKIAGVAMASLMAVSLLAGCAGQNGGTTQSANELVIGGSGPLTGAASSYGIAVRNGAQLAVDEINAAGGVNGITLKLEFEDDEHKADTAINAYNTVKDKGAKVFMGTVTSGPCIAVVDLTHADHMFQITPSGSAIDSIKYDNAFRVCFNDDNQGIASAQYIKAQNLGTKIAVIYQSDIDYSTGIFAKFKEEAAKQGLEIVAEQTFTADSATDFSVQIQQVKNSGADLVFLPIYYEAAAAILQQANRAGLETKYFGCDGLDSIIGQLGEDAALAEGVMLLTPYVKNSTEPKSKAFTDAYIAKYPEETLNQFAADGYDAIYAIKAAMEKAEIKDASISIEDLCDKLTAAMTEITLEGVTGTITWTADGEPTKDPKGMVIQNGEYSAID